MKRYLVFPFLFLAFPLFLSTESNAQFSATILEINPDNSTYDATDPDGASGGRVNGLGAAGDGSAFYAASEWGGIFKSIDRGMSWFRLNAHLPVAAWDVEVDPLDPNKVYAASFYDGRVNSMAGINVSFDGGLSWIHPTITVPYSPYSYTERLEEPSAFGISIDPENNTHVYIGTNTGLAVSTDAGNTWEFIDPTPSDPASNIWDVVVHHGGIIDIIGDDGHLRSTDGGGSWFGAPIGLPSGRGSIAASPHEPDVIFVAIAENLYESDDGGGNWTMLGTPDQRRKRQGRIPFVVTNPRTNSTFDVWYGDARLYRGYCNSNPSGGGLRCPQAYTNPMPLPPAAPSLPLPNGWAGPFTRYAGGHDDVGDLIIEPDVDENGCPVLFSSDGGVYYNTLASTSQCQDPYWEQPLVTPHGLWLFGFDGANRPGGVDEYLYFGNQDNGPFVSNNAGAAAPAWFNKDCCDGFDYSAGPNIVLYTLCCFSGGRSNQLFLRNSEMLGGGEVNNYPPGTFRGFTFDEVIDRFGPDDFVVVTTEGVFLTNDVTAVPIVWSPQLGAATSPGRICNVQASWDGFAPVFYVQHSNVYGGCDDRRPNPKELWKFTGINPAGPWHEIIPPDGIGGFGIFAVDPHNSNRLFASHLRPLGPPQMVMSEDGGTTWRNIPALDDLMAGSGVFRYQNRVGPTNFTGFQGYAQPTLVAFDPFDDRIMVAGGADSGVFISIDGGICWRRVTDPFTPHISGIPHIPRPRYAHFEHLSTNEIDIYIGSQGRGVWKVSLALEDYRYEYAAKILCGRQDDAEDYRLIKGVYGTSINIHNPNDVEVSFCKKLALTYPPEEQAPGQIIGIASDLLKPDEALKVDCNDIQKRLFPDSLPAPYFEGFVVLKSGQMLDVTSVYSTAAISPAGSISHSGIDVEPVQGRRLRNLPPSIPTPDSLPDLIPLRPDNDLSEYCITNPQGFEDFGIGVRVRNQGPASSPATVTCVDLEFGGRICQSTPALAPGEEAILNFPLPAEACQIISSGRLECPFTITVNTGMLPESDFTNNTVDGICKGPG